MGTSWKVLKREMMQKIFREEGLAGLKRYGIGYNEAREHAKVFQYRWRRRYCKEEQAKTI